MGEKWVVGVDLGGTTIKMAFINEIGHMIAKWEINTNITDNGIHVVYDIKKSIENKLIEFGCTKEKLIGVGIGAPGPINMETGVVYEAVNLFWENYPLKANLEKLLSLPVFVDNDANIAALGEMWNGAGKGAKDLICVTLGTGVGGGIITNGNIVHGINCAAGEIGHITSIPEGGAICNCGKTGCLETIASATGIVRLALEKINESNIESLLHKEYQSTNVMTAKMVFDAAKKNDPLSLEIIDYVTFHLGFALANLANSLNPEKIVIGGGVSKAGEFLIEKVVQHFQKFVFPRVFKSTIISLATLGNDAGVFGGAWLVKINLIDGHKTRMINENSEYGVF